MGVVPNIMHFIAPTAPFTRTELLNIMAWISENPVYEPYLWVGTGQHQAVYREIVRVSKVMPSTVEVLVSMLSTMADAKWKTHHGDFHIRIRQLDSFYPLAPMELLRIELDDFRRKHAIRDIASFWVLYYYGGIFIDTDTAPPELPLRPDIEAPRNILLAKYHRSFPKLVTNVVAGCRKAPELVSLHNEFVAHYRRDVSTEDPLNPRLRHYTAAKMEDLDRWERMLSLDREIEHPDSGKREEIRATRQEIRSRKKELCIGERTSRDITGNWIRKQLGDIEMPPPMPPIIPPPPPLPSGERVPPDFLEPVVVSTAPHIDTGEEREWLNTMFREEARDELQDFLEYSFQDQSGCHPVIPRDAWDFGGKRRGRFA